jgi:hypothetical protein
MGETGNEKDPAEAGSWFSCIQLYAIEEAVYNGSERGELLWCFTRITY